MKHPGKIVFVDGKTHQITDTLQAAEVPESIRFAETAKGWVPVVKIVEITTDKERFIHFYGPDDQFLKSTIQVREPREDYNPSPVRPEEKESPW